VGHSAWLWLRFRLSAPPRRTTRIAVRAHGVRVDFRLRDFIDVCVAEEVFVEEVYEFRDAGRPDVILDLGSHIGLSILWFHARFPDARIYGFEPDPASFELLKRNTDGIANVSVKNVAVGGSRRHAEFFSARQSWLSSLLPSETSAGGGVTVEVQPIEQMLEDIGSARADVLKLDVEGAEWEILEHTALDSVADIVLGELHAHGSPDGRPDSGLTRLGSFDLEVRQNDANCCVFVGRRALLASRPTGIT
jgi:FkbM family methyltransferase